VGAGAAAHFAARHRKLPEREAAVRTRVSLTYLRSLGNDQGQRVANPGRRQRRAQVQIIHAHQLWQISCMDFCLSG
jgi:hypothetical protein